MKLLRSVLVLAVAAGFVLCAMNSDVAGQGKGGKKKFGKVTKVDIKDGAGSITVESKKDKDSTELVKTTYKVNKDTKFFDAPKEKGEKATPVDAKDVSTKLKVDAFVSIGLAEGSEDTAGTI